MRSDTLAETSRQIPLLRGERIPGRKKIHVLETTRGRFRDALGAYVGCLIVRPAVRRVLAREGVSIS